MSIEGIEADLCNSFRLHKDPDRRDTHYLMTPFAFGDGDGYTLCLTIDDEGPMLSDRGDTMFRLDEWNWTPSRRRSVEALADAAGVAVVEDEFVRRLRPGQSAMWDVVEMLRFISQVDGLRYQQADSDDEEETFVTTLRNTVRRVTPHEVSGRWYAPQDPQRIYHADMAIERDSAPILIAFAVSTSYAASNSALAVYQYRRWQVQAEPIAIVSDDERNKSADMFKLQDAFGDNHVHRQPRTDRAMGQLLERYGVAA